MARWPRFGLKATLLAATALSMLSVGGLLIFTFPLLAIGLWWAVRHAGIAERTAWIVVGALAAAEWGWQIAYPVHGGATPSSLIIAVIAGAIMATPLGTVAPHFSLRRSSAQPASRTGAGGGPVAR